MYYANYKKEESEVKPLMKLIKGVVEVTTTGEKNVSMNKSGGLETPNGKETINKNPSNSFS